MKLARSLAVALIMLCYSIVSCFGDPPDAGRISILRGGNVIFIFNAMDKYSNGITLSNWTVLKLTYTDLGVAQSTLKWSLKVHAAQSTIQRSGGGGAIPLDSLLITVKVDTNAPVVYANQLTDDYSTAIELLPSVVENPPVYTHDVTISYQMLMTKSLSATLPSGFYYVDLVFDLYVE